MQRYRWLVVLVILACAAYVLLSRPPPHKPLPTAAPEPSVTARFGGKEVQVWSPDGKSLLWRAQMQAAEYQQDTAIGRLWGAECTLMENGQPAASVSAQQTIWMPATQTLHFKGKVVAYSASQQVELAAAELTWFWDRGDIIAKDVSLQRGQVCVTARRAIADTALRRVRLYDRVQAQMPLPGPAKSVGGKQRSKPTK